MTVLIQAWSQEVGEGMLRMANIMKIGKKKKNTMWNSDREN